MNDMLKLLPHQSPFRFLDQVTDYRPGLLLCATFTFRSLAYKTISATELIPEICLMEGIAQSAVLLVQLEAGPLLPGEYPLLGHISAIVTGTVQWGESVRYEVRPIRIEGKRAIMEGIAYGAENRICVSAEMTLAVATRDGL